MVARRSSGGVVAAAVVAVALAAPVTAADPEPAEPALASVLARGAAEGKPVVLELGAVWCEPCVRIKQLDGDPAVERARAGVVFARYDLDAPIGSAVAARFGVSSVPTVLVLDGEGRVVDRLSGAPDASPALTRWLVDVFADAAAYARVAAGGAASPADRARAARVTAARAFRTALAAALVDAGRACSGPAEAPFVDVVIMLRGGRRTRVSDVDGGTAPAATLACLRRTLARAPLPALPRGQAPFVMTRVALTPAAPTPAPAAGH